MQVIVVILFAIAAISADVLKPPINSPVYLKDPRILNGEEVALGQLPYVVGLLTVDPTLNMTYFCGGSIISEEWILTSAYCIFNSTYSIVYSGTVDINDPNRNLALAQTHVVHEDFKPDPYMPDRFHYDIGLVKLDTPLVFDDNTKAIALAEEELGDGILVTLTGFGHIAGDYGNDHDNSSNTLLHSVMVPTMNNSECGRYVEYADTPGIFCTYFHFGDEMIKNACLGDGGSPVILNADTNPVHVGLVSFIAGFGCNSTWPTGHTRTAFYREWIREKTGV